MQILGLSGMYFDAVVVEVEKYLLFFRLVLAILCLDTGVRHLQIVNRAVGTALGAGGRTPARFF